MQLHLEIKVDATQMGSCYKEFDNILLLHFQDTKESRCCENFPLSYNENLEQCCVDHTLGSVENLVRVILNPLSDNS